MSARRLLLSRLAGVLILAAILSAAWHGATAHAAGYTVWSCRTPEGTPASTAGWNQGGAGGTVADTCATGGAIRVELAPAEGEAQDVIGTQFLAPPGATIERYRVWMSAAVSPTIDGSSYAAGLSESEGLGVRGFTAGCLYGPTGCSFGQASDPLAAGNLVEATGVFSGIAVAARCITDSGCTAASAPAASAELYRSAVDLTDPEAPVIGSLSGSLLTDTSPGLRSLMVPVTDRGGGVERVRLFVDGTLVQTRSSGGACRQPYDVAAPCPSDTDRAFTVDTGSLLPGTHAVAVEAADAAGNISGSAPLPFTVQAVPPAAIPPPSLPTSDLPAAGPGAPAPGTRTLRITLPARVAAPSRRPIAGTARWDDGSPATGVNLTVLQRGIGQPVSRGRRLLRLSVDRRGRFDLPIGAASRVLRVRPTDQSQDAVAAETTVVAPLRARFRAPDRMTRNGQSATFVGRISGAGAAVRDLRALVQVIVRGRWTTVASVTPTASGGIRWTYRFRRTTVRSDYRFRLRIPRTPSLPWATISSPRTVARVEPSRLVR